MLWLLTATCMFPGERTPEPAPAVGTGPGIEKAAADRCLQVRADPPPKSFTTDGCTLWPEGTWTQCCVEHDMAYWCGGSAQDRERADQALRVCVARSSESFMPRAMYFGVRAAAAPWIPAPWRWGYGWSWPRGYENER